MYAGWAADQLVVNALAGQAHLLIARWAYWFTAIRNLDTLSMPLIRRTAFQLPSQVMA
jgi:hypothetical protein